MLIKNSLTTTIQATDSYSTRRAVQRTQLMCLGLSKKFPHLAPLLFAFPLCHPTELLLAKRKHGGLGKAGRPVHKRVTIN